MNTAVYSGTIDWEEAVFEVFGYTGEGRFRFVFASDDAGIREGWYIDDVEFFGSDTLWSGAGDRPPRILRPAIGPSRPNPGAAGLRIQFDVPARGTVGLEVYDIAGRQVQTLITGTLPPGKHEVPWDGRDQAGRAVPSGTYFCRLSCAGGHATHRLVLVR